MKAERIPKARGAETDKDSPLESVENSPANG